MTWSAPRARTRSTLPVLHTPVTSAPNALAICTAKVPTPPEAPTISTLCPGSTRPRSRRPCRAVTAEQGAGGGGEGGGGRLLEGEVGRLGGQLVRAGGHVLGERAVAGAVDRVVRREAGHAGVDGFDRSGETSAGVGVLGPADAESGEPEGIGEAGHDVPGAPVHAGGVHPYQDLAVPDGGPVDPCDPEEVLGRGAVAVLNNGLHRLSAGVRGRRASEGFELRGGHRNLSCRGRTGSVGGHHISGLAQDVRPVERRGERRGRAGERERARHEQPPGRPAVIVDRDCGCHRVSTLDDVQNLYDVQEPSTLSGVTSMETVGTTAEPVRRRRPGPRRALTEDEILDAALCLLDDGGANAASIRGIAAKVGVAPNAVYTYFPDKAAVIKALVERLLGEVDHDVFADRSRPWPERVEALALDLRTHLSAHPGAVSLMNGA